MKNILASVFKPKDKHAIWLIISVFTIVTILASIGWLEIIRELLDSETMSFELGNYCFSIYRVIKSFIAISLLVWIGKLLLGIGETKLKKIKGIKASNRTLLIKAYQSLLYFFLFITSLNVLGIDLTAFTVFSGAVGIGIGFGLQKISSNFISGLILLFEKSIEEGDFIELSDGTVGIVKNTNARYTLIETFESREIMVPNDEFITQRITNWTFSNNQSRISINVGVAYDSDLEKTISLLLEAAREHPRCSHIQPAACYLSNFGESSADFILYFWIDDVKQGKFGAKSDVMLSIIKKFKENGIIMPFPQHTIHLTRND